MFVRPSDVVPKKLSIWPSAMMIAMPDVKPIMTGIGMKLMSRPSRSTPAMSSNTPAAKHAKNTPCSPCAATMPTSTALIAPVGPGDLERRAAEQRDHDTGDDGRNKTRRGGSAGRNAERERERQRHGAHRETGENVLHQLRGVVAGKLSLYSGKKRRKHDDSSPKKDVPAHYTPQTACSQ